MILTSYYAMIRNFPSNIKPISISLYKPKNLVIDHYVKLAPTQSILSEYKLTGNEDVYKHRFKTEVLNNLNAINILNELDSLYGRNTHHLALCCYEKSDKFCHRHIVAEWLSKELSKPILEYENT